MKSDSNEWAKAGKFADDFIAFNKTAISPFHVVANVETLLTAQNFIRIDENQNWSLTLGNSYYLIRDGALIAFRVPPRFSGADSGFKLIATHTDSPCLRLAPRFEAGAADLAQCFVQCYGGGLWHTWLDRELLLGGRVALVTDNGIRTALFALPFPVAAVPNLAIHLRRDREKLELNKEFHLRPIIGSTTLCGQSGIREAISEGLATPKEHILGFDLCFADANPPTRFGLNGEFIASARIDNLFSVFCSLRALLEREKWPKSEEFSENEELPEECDVTVLCMFDAEEIGSKTRAGADSAFLRDVLERVSASLGAAEDFQRILNRSFLLSCDMAHAQHPNYAAQHQSGHTPRLNGGIVLKTNCNGRYTTDACSAAMVRALAAAVDVPLIDFVTNNESPCGSTVGPFLAAALGCYSADIGAAMLAMHSARETAGVLDFYYYIKLLKAFVGVPLEKLRPSEFGASDIFGPNCKSS